MDALRQRFEAAGYRCEMTNNAEWPLKVYARNGVPIRFGQHVTDVDGAFAFGLAALIKVRRK